MRDIQRMRDFNERRHQQQYGDGNWVNQVNNDQAYNEADERVRGPPPLPRGGAPLEETRIEVHRNGGNPRKRRFRVRKPHRKTSHCIVAIVEEANPSRKLWHKTWSFPVLHL